MTKDTLVSICIYIYRLYQCIYIYMYHYIYIYITIYIYKYWGCLLFLFPYPPHVPSFPQTSSNYVFELFGNYKMKRSREGPLDPFMLVDRGSQWVSHNDAQ